MLAEDFTRLRLAFLSITPYKRLVCILAKAKPATLPQPLCGNAFQIRRRCGTLLLRPSLLQPRLLHVTAPPTTAFAKQLLTAAATAFFKAALRLPIGVRSSVHAHVGYTMASNLSLTTEPSIHDLTWPAAKRAYPWHQLSSHSADRSLPRKASPYPFACVPRNTC